MGYNECKNCKNTFYTASDDNNLCEFCGGERNNRKIGYIAYVWNKQLIKEQIRDHPENAPQHLKRIIERQKRFKEESKIAAEIKIKLDLVDKSNEADSIKPEIASSFGLASVSKFKKSKIIKKRHIDFFEKNLKNSATGKKGEEVVLQLEKNELIMLNRSDLALKVKQISINDDSVGFDILSFDQKGQEKLIEVKTSVLPKREEFSFYISENEKRVAEESTNYFIYLVFDVNNIPTVIKLKNPFSLGILQLQPSQYKVKGSLSKS